MTEKLKSILIGAFVLIAALAFMGVLLFLRPSVGDGKRTLYVCFTSIDKIQIGTRVTFAGKAIGEVAGIEPIYDARAHPTGRSGNVCFYELRLQIDSHAVIYDTDEITVNTTGLLGEKTIAIIPRAVQKGEPSYPVTDQLLHGKSTDPIEEALSQIISISKKAGTAIDQINTILEENREEIKESFIAFKQAAKEVSTTFQEINENALIPKINGIATNMQDASSHLNSVLGALDEPSSLKSSLHQFSSLLSKSNILFNDINNYGLLFHTNKQWKRLRAERINLLDRLSCPLAFKGYFNEEMAHITCSLNRIFMALEKAKCSKNKCFLLSEQCFTKEFKELLDEVSHMEEMLEVYKTELFERYTPTSCSPCP